VERLPRLGYILLGSLWLFWGLSWPMMKMALGEIRPWTFRSLCLLLGSFGIFAIIKISRLRLSIPKNEIRPLIILALFNVTGWHLFSAYGLIYMKAGRAAIVAYTMPVWASILATILLQEKFTYLRILGLALGMLSLAILIGPNIHVMRKDPLGALFMIGAAISWAVGTVLIKYFRFTLSTLNLTAWQSIIGTFPVIIGTLIIEPFPEISNLSWRALIATVYVIVLGNIYCYWAWIKVVQLFPAGLASTGSLAIPVIGVFSSGLILREPIGIQEISALIVMVFALSLVLFKH